MEPSCKSVTYKSVTEASTLMMRFTQYSPDVSNIIYLFFAVCLCTGLVVTLINTRTLREGRGTSEEFIRTFQCLWSSSCWQMGLRRRFNTQWQYKDKQICRYRKTVGVRHQRRHTRLIQQKISKVNALSHWWILAGDLLLNKVLKEWNRSAIQSHVVRQINDCQ